MREKDLRRSRSGFAPWYVHGQRIAFINGSFVVEWRDHEGLESLEQVRLKHNEMLAATFSAKAQAPSRDEDVCPLSHGSVRARQRWHGPAHVARAFATPRGVGGMQHALHAQGLPRAASERTRLQGSWPPLRDCGGGPDARGQGSGSHARALQTWHPIYEVSQRGCQSRTSGVIDAVCSHVPSINPLARPSRLPRHRIRRHPRRDHPRPEHERVHPRDLLVSVLHEREPQ